MAATGLVSYGYFSLASHALDAASYGRVTLLWSAVFVTVSILYRPVEQLLSRSIADHEARRAAGTRHLRVAAQVQVTLALAFVTLALALRGPIEDGLFDGSAALFWIMVATVLAYAGGYYARGVLAGRRRFSSYGALLFLESSTRVTFAIAVAVGIASGESVVALGMAVGPAVSLAVVAAVAARASRRRGDPAEAPPADPAAALTAVPAAASTADPAATPPAVPTAPPPADPGRPPTASAAEPELSLAHGAGYAGAVLLIMASEQAFLTAGPLLINATEAVAGAALAGFAFNALLIARAPLQLFQSVQASILPHLTRLRAGGRSDPFRRSVHVTLIAIAGFAGVVTLALAAVGPETMELLFGGEFDYARGGLVLMGVGMGLYLAAATLTQAALARGHATGASARWVAAGGAFVVLLLVPRWRTAYSRWRWRSPAGLSCCSRFCGSCTFAAAIPRGRPARGRKGLQACGGARYPSRAPARTARAIRSAASGRASRSAAALMVSIRSGSSSSASTSRRRRGPPISASGTTAAAPASSIQRAFFAWWSAVARG